MSRVEYGAGPDLPPVSGWAISGIWFAAAVMLLIGTFQILGGNRPDRPRRLLRVGRHYAFAINVTAWGWFDLFFGIIIVPPVWRCSPAAPGPPMTALILAILSAVNNFLFIAYYPWWSLLAIALDVWVIWALTRPGSGASRRPRAGADSRGKAAARVPGADPSPRLGLAPP